MHAATTFRPRPLSADTLRKIDLAKRAVARRQRIERIRAGLQEIIEALEREQEARRLAAVGGNSPSRLLIEALAASGEFDLLIEEIR